MAKYRRETSIDLIDTSRTWNAHQCNSYMVVNHGNVNVTVNNAMVLRPGQWLSSPTENPDIIDDSDLDFQFDDLNQPEVTAPTTGTQPSQTGGPVAIGDPPPARDKRVVVFKSYLSKIEE